MISVYISIVLFCFQWLFKPYISKLLCQLIFRLYCSLHHGFESWLYCWLHLWANLRYVHKNKRCWNQSSVCLCCPVSGLIPDLKRSDGSFPQASCQLSLVSPVNRELKRRVPVECSNRYKVEKLSVTAVMQLRAIELYIQWTYIDTFRNYGSQFELIAWSVWLIHFATAKLLFRYYDKKPWETFF